MDSHEPGLNGRPQVDSWGSWLTWLDVALHQEILSLRSRYELSQGELRGLYVSDAQVDDLVQCRVPSPEVRTRLAGLDHERRWLLDAARASASRLGDLAERFALDDADLVALVLCVAPELKLGYRTIYAYVNDDVSRRLPTVDLCQRLAGGPLREERGVVAQGLVRVVRNDPADVWRAAGLLLPDPVRRHLLGRVAPCGAVMADEASPQMDARRTLPGVVVVEAPVLPDAIAEARRLVAAAGREVVFTDPEAADPQSRLSDAVVQARLRDAVLCVTAADFGFASGDGNPLPDAVVERWRRLVCSDVDLAVCLSPGAGDRLPLNGLDHERVRVQPLDLVERVTRWTEELEARGVAVRPEDVGAVSALFVLSAAQIAAAASTASRGGAVDAEALTAAARAQCAFGLAVVAEAVPTVYDWDDLVVPTQTLRRLADLAAAIRHRHRVFDAWAFGRLHGGHASVRAIFSGPSGTGKTMAASVLARDLGLELYRVDLSTVVSKYVGETEKNLERVLTAAEHSNALLLFDEADALFGKRSEVRDAHDRYANIEIAFLLQRIESYEGVLLLSTNLAGNLDDAFHRRLHFHVEFPMPDEAARRRLWERAIPGSAPIDDDVDPSFLAGMFPMTGGEIRSATLAAAFMAADAGVPIGMSHLTLALARQRRQQGKLPSSCEFQGFLRLVQKEGS